MKELNQIGKQALGIAEVRKELEDSSNVELTLDDVMNVMPKGMKRYFSPENLEKVNLVLANSDHAHVLRDNLINYSNVFRDHSFNMNAYLNAVQYVTYKMCGLSNMDAWIKTFPETYKDLVTSGRTEQISPRVSAYNNSKAVSSIMEQAMIPAWLMNIDAYQEAIQVQVEIMRTAKSEKVRSDAANSLLNHLKAPEKAKMQLDITVNQKNFIGDLREVVKELVDVQEAGIRSGNVSVIDVAEYRVIKGEEEDEQ